MDKYADSPVLHYRWNNRDQCFYARFSFWPPGQFEILTKQEGMETRNLFKRFGIESVREPDEYPD